MKTKIEYKKIGDKRLSNILAKHWTERTSRDTKDLELHMVWVLRHIPHFKNLKRRSRRSKIDCSDGNNNFVELKWRFSSYTDTMIEYDKFCHMKAIGQANQFYAVQTDGLIFVFFINKLVHQGFEFQWDYENCNTTTTLRKSTDGIKKPKKQAKIPWHLASAVMDLQGNRLPNPIGHFDYEMAITTEDAM